MATTAFALLEQRTASACVAGLANAQAIINGADPVDVIFDNGHTNAEAGPFGVSSTQPRITCATASLPANPVESVVVVAGGNYVVAEHHPDGTGISLLLLEAR